MKPRAFLYLLSPLFLVSAVFAQRTATDWYREAERLYQAEDYAASASAYDASIAAGASMPDTYYNAACAHALAAQPDAAFRWLAEAIARGWRDVDHLLADTDLRSMHADERWKPTVQKCREARSRFLESLAQPELYLELMEMKRVDQEYRSRMHVLPRANDAHTEHEEGHEQGHDHGHGEPDGHSRAHGDGHSHELDVDAKHTARMKQIVKQYGWPTNSMVGEEGATAAWLLVQHADADPSFQRHCLELMRKVPAGEVSTNDLAYLTDRVLVNEGKEQLYGTQFWLQGGKLVPRPIQDEANLEARRKEMGMIPFSRYLEHMTGPHDH